MRVIITGGSGLIGSALAAELLERGDDVIVTSRDPATVEGVPRAAGVVRWDGETARGLVAFLAGADAVVHLAGAGIGDKRWSDERKRLILESRTRSTAALAEALERSSDRPGVVLQASAVGFYGSRGDEELSETSAPGDGFLADVCQLWEEAGEGIEALGVRRCLLRTGVVLAEHGGALPKMALPFKLFVGGPVGGGGQWVPWIHLKDETGAIRFLLGNEEASGVFNLTAPEPVTNEELGRRVGAVLGRPSFVPTPAFAMKLALGEMAELLLASQRALPEELTRAGYRFRFPTVDAALRDLLGRG